MKHALWLLALALVVCASPVGAQTKDPTPREGMSPLERAKIKRAEASFRRGFGVAQGPKDSPTNGRPGVSSCTANVGTTYVQNTPGQRAAKLRGDTVVVVRGDVINVCK